MIEFKQKEFWGMAIATGAQMVQGGIQNKKNMAQQEEFQNQQARLQKKQTEAMNNIAKAAQKDPSKAQAAAGVLQQQKSYAAPAFLQKAGQTAYEFARGLNRTGGGNQIVKKLGHGLAMGTTMAAIGYGVDKAIQADRKRITGGAPVPKPEISPEEKKKKRNKTIAKIAAGTALAAGSVLAARKGYLGSGMENLYKKATGPGAGARWKNKLGQVGREYKKGFKEQFVGPDGKINKVGTAMTLGFGAMGGLGYLGERKQLKAQAKAQQEAQQKQYANLNEAQPQPQKKKGSVLKKAAIGTAAVVGTVAAARRGALGSGIAKKTNDMFMTYGKKIAGSKGNKLGNWMMESGSKQWGKADLRSLTKKLKSRAADPANAKTASALTNLDKEKIIQRRGARRLNAIKSGKASDTVGETVLSGASNLMGISKKQTNSFLTQMAKDTNNSDATRRAAEWLGRHKKTALVGATAVGSLSFKPFTWGDTAVKKSIGAVDKNAFAYEKSKEQQVPQE